MNDTWRTRTLILASIFLPLNGSLGNQSILFFFVISRPNKKWSHVSSVSKVVDLSILREMGNRGE